MVLLKKNYLFIIFLPSKNIIFKISMITSLLSILFLLFLEAAHNPGGNRHSDVGTEDNRNIVQERQKPPIDKRDHHQRGGGLTLN